jgi:hypothetical protein
MPRSRQAARFPQHGFEGGVDLVARPVAFMANPERGHFVQRTKGKFQRLGQPGFGTDRRFPIPGMAGDAGIRLRGIRKAREVADAVEAFTGDMAVQTPESGLLRVSGDFQVRLPVLSP